MDQPISIFDAATYKELREKQPCWQRERQHRLPQGPSDVLRPLQLASHNVAAIEGLNCGCSNLADSLNC